MPKTPKAGDDVLFYGRMLTVQSVDDTLVVVRDADQEAKRAAARERLVELRAEQADALPNAHRRIAEEIEALSKDASSLVAGAKLRVDLLEWWPERKCWTSPGRILSNDQVDRFVKITGGRPQPGAHRAALDLLDGKGA